MLDGKQDQNPRAHKSSEVKRGNQMFAIRPNGAMSTRLQFMIQFNTLQEAKQAIFSVKFANLGEPERRVDSEGETDASEYRTSRPCLLDPWIPLWSTYQSNKGNLHPSASPRLIPQSIIACEVITSHPRVTLAWGGHSCHMPLPGPINLRGIHRFAV